MSKVWNAFSKVLTGAATTAKVTADLGASATYDALRLGTSIISNSIMKRPGTYKQNLLSGNIIPLKLKPLVGVGLVGAIGAAGIGTGIYQHGQIDTEGMDATQNITGVMSSQASPKKRIDDMGASGDLVFAMNKNR